jgi:hypothetical protein
MPEHDQVTCSCRDRDTRVLRAIIAAASRVETDASTPPSTDTDLLWPQSGNSGNNVGRLVDVLVREGVLPGDLLMAAWMTLPGVPMAAQTVKEVQAFVADVDATRRHAYLARQLAHEVHAAVMAHKELEWRIREDMRRMREREAELEARQEGTYWRERDGRRVAKQPTHVLVDPDAWRAMKDEARRQHTTVGELVGVWLQDTVSDPSQLADGKRQSLPNRRGKSPLLHMVSRIDVDKDDWAWAKTDAASLGVTIARYVGMVVESHASRSARTRRLRRPPAPAGPPIP